MKIKFAFFLFAPILLWSCKQSRPPVTIIDKKYDDHTIKVDDLREKVDENGVAQCSKYMFTQYDQEGKTHLYGLSFPQLIARMYRTGIKYVVLGDLDSMKFKYYDVQINRLGQDSLHYDSIAVREVLDYYGFSLERQTEKVQGYELIVDNSAKLNRYLADPEITGPGVLRYKDDAFEMEFYRISGIARMYDDHTREYVIFRGNDESRYTLEFPFSRDFDKANHSLAPLGLRLKRSEFEIGKIFVRE